MPKVMGNLSCGRKKVRIRKSKEPDPITGLSPREIDLIRYLWYFVLKKMTPQEAAKTFFIKLFGSHPHLREFFPDFALMTADELGRNHHLVAHGITVFSAISNYVDALEEPLTLVALMQKHANFHYRIGVTLVEMELAEEVLLKFLKSSVPRNALNKEALAAWSKFLNAHDTVFRNQCRYLYLAKVKVLFMPSRQHRASVTYDEATEELQELKTSQLSLRGPRPRGLSIFHPLG